MINLGKRPSPPEYLEEDDVINEYNKIFDMYHDGYIKDGKNKFKGYDFKPIWRQKANKVKKKLMDHQNNKCCYCESKIDISRETDVEHFRPCHTEHDAGNLDHLGYWWLAFDWENYLASCKVCNQSFKKNQFPLADITTRACADYDDPADEKRIMIDPYSDNPEELIAYTVNQSLGEVWANPRTNQNPEKMNIDKVLNELTGINSDLNCERRGELILTMNALATAYQKASGDEKTQMFEDIQKYCDPSREFSGFKKYFFKDIRCLAELFK